MAALYVPEDVLEGILSRLPVESILRFKCVCKSWYSLFQNPTFVAKHLSNQSVDHIFIKRFLTVRARYDACYLSKDIEDNYAHFAVNAELTFITDFFLFSVIGHCDGLIAFRDRKDVRICNPATRELRTLPHPSFHPFSFPSPSTHYAYYRTFTDFPAIGFGYDSNTNDYKVVRVVRFYDCHDYSSTLDCTAEVFSIRNDSSWRRIKYSMGYTFFCPEMELHQVYYNGIYYWLGTEGKTGSREAVLMSFNMGNEEFQKVSMHNDWLLDYIDYTNLGVYNNEFIAMYTFYPAVSSWMDVWVMKEFGVKESWTKVLTIEPIPVIMRRLLTFWKNDKELLLEDEEGNLCSFDLVTKEFKCHGLGSIYSRKHWSAVPYMKTIVSVNTKEEDEEDEEEEGIVL